MKKLGLKRGWWRIMNYATIHTLKSLKKETNLNHIKELSFDIFIL
jgi:hypothetical protein